MKIRTALLALALALAAGPSAAQLSTDTRLGSILQAIRLPRATQEARVLGVPDSDIRVIFDRARQQQVAPGDITGLFEDGCESMREHGPIDNFGAFVQSKLDQGLRGRDLAAAIRAEHVAHGKGKAYLKQQGKGHDADHDAMNAPGRSNAAKDRERAARPGGKPDATGKPGGPGKSDEAKGKKGGGR